MAAQIIDGKAFAAELQKKLAMQAAELKDQYGLVPGFGSVLVGENPASVIYVRTKGRACQEMGIRHFERKLPENASQEEVEAAIEELNANPEVHGIMVQLPLPPHLDEEAVLTKVSLQKDVDGFHPTNIGHLAMKGREPLFIPCTPKGIIALLDHAGARLNGSRAVVVGRSNIVGLPVAYLLIRRNATVTICHSRTADLGEVTRQADILVVGIGRPRAIRGDMVKPGAVVIDVGINRIPDPQSKTGYRLVGDVAFEEVVEVASAITPVPGGVGPMTVVMLLENTITAALRHWRAAELLPEDEIPETIRK